MRRRSRGSASAREDPEFAEVLKKYYAEPFYRDAATMNVEDPQEVEDLKANLAQ